MRILGAITATEYERHGGLTHERLTVRKYASGEQRVTLTRRQTLSEPPIGWDMFNGWETKLEQSARGSGDREVSIASSVRRSKAAILHKVRCAGLDAMWTLTYQDLVTDRLRVRQDWDYFCKLLRLHIPGFTYVCVLEAQERGSLHLHIATHKLPARFVVRGHSVKSWDLVRGLWRRAIGGGVGSFVESARSKQHPRASSFRPESLVGYLVKYIAKDLETSALNARRYWSGGSFPEPVEVVTDRIVSDDESFGPDGRRRFSDLGLCQVMQESGPRPPYVRPWCVVGTRGAPQC